MNKLQRKAQQKSNLQKRSKKKKAIYSLFSVYNRITTLTPAVKKSHNQLIKKICTYTEEILISHISI